MTSNNISQIKNILIFNNNLKQELKNIILQILNYAKNNNLIDKYYEKCVFEFYFRSNAPIWSVLGLSESRKIATNPPGP